MSPFISDPAGLAGPYDAGGPVGPYGTLSPFSSDPDGPDDLYVAGGPVSPFGTLFPSDSGSAILVDRWTLVDTQSPVEGIVGKCGVVTEENITVHGGWPDPDVVGTPAVVVMVGMNALPIRNDSPFDCGDGDTAWIARNGYQIGLGGSV